MNKNPYQLSLDEWETLLDKGPVHLKPVIGTATISRLDGCYRWRTDLPFGLWTELERETLADLFINALFLGISFADPLAVDADAQFVAMLSGGEP